MVQSQNRYHSALQKHQDRGKTQHELSLYLRSNPDWTDIRKKYKRNSFNDDDVGLLNWLLSTEGEDSTRVNQTELLEAKKIFLKWVPKMQYAGGLKFLKSNPNLLTKEKGHVGEYAPTEVPPTQSALKRNESSIHPDKAYVAPFPVAPGKKNYGKSSDANPKRKYRLYKPKRAQKHPKPIVPKIVHLIWFRPRGPRWCTFRFHNLISILSVHKFIQPEYIFVWHNNTPCGHYWNEAAERIPNIVMKKTRAPTSVFGQSIQVIEHQTDVARINIILNYGGIYIDLDVVALKAWDPLLYYETTMGAENPNLLGSGVITAIPNSKFIALWLESYKDFYDIKWNYNSCVMPTKLSRKYPELVHIEWDTMHSPSWNEVEWLYDEGKLWDWSLNYCVHLWYRYHRLEHSPEDIRKINTTMAEIFRYVYYGTPDML